MANATKYKILYIFSSKQQLFEAYIIIRIRKPLQKI